MPKEAISTLKQGICAYNYGNYVEAFSHFQFVAQNSVEPMMQDQAKKNLIKTYRKLGKKEEAIELCKTFLGHNVYHLWAVKTLEKLGVNPEETSYEETDGELSAPFLPPELEEKDKAKNFYTQLLDRVKRFLQTASLGKLFHFFNQS